MLLQGSLYRIQFVLREAEVLPKARRSLRAVQCKDGLVAATDDMYVRRPVVVGINRDAKTWKPQNGRHRKILATQLFGIKSTLVDKTLHTVYLQTRTVESKSARCLGHTVGDGGVSSATPGESKSPDLNLLFGRL